MEGMWVLWPDFLMKSLCNFGQVTELHCASISASVDCVFLQQYVLQDVEVPIYGDSMFEGLDFNFT